MGKNDFKAYLERLESWFNGKNGAITAFSGGIDSTLVLYLSKFFLGERAVGCISISPSLKRKDYAFAMDFCQKNQISLEVIETAELLDSNYLSNPSNRCYFCKSHLYESLMLVKNKYPSYDLLNGTNTDDLGDYRPGLQAADEHGILSPLVDCGISKDMVRHLARHFELPNCEKPASPCLSSRIPYGSAITIDKLAQVEKAEAMINDYGFQDVRVRHFGNKAVIEVPISQIPELEAISDIIIPKILALGFTGCTIDKEGLISGKLNRSLEIISNEGVRS
jgi:uncharacterized protein